MPYRSTPIVSGETYHVFNRSIARQPIFRTQQEYLRAIELIKYYRFIKLPLRYSHFNRLSKERKQQFMERYIKKSKPALEIFSYCTMPNHVHFLLQQIDKNAISNFMRNFQNGYSKYFNLKHNRTGSLFQAMFKAVRIETDEQLLHVSRYIHLNPTSSYIIKQNSLERYPWSSFKDYVKDNETDSFVNTASILDHFKSRKKYKEFVFDQVDYQRELENIKHLILE